MKRTGSLLDRPTKKANVGRKPGLQRQPSVAQLAQQVALASNEKKYNDITLNQDANTTPIVTALTTFGTGDTALLRDGNKAIIKSIDVKVRITNNSIAQSNSCRFVVVCDKLAQAEQCLWGTASSVADVFDSEQITARRNILSAERFIVLADEVVVVNQQGGTGAGQSQAYFHRYIKVPQALQLIAWSGASATIPVKNAFSILYMGSTVSGVTDAAIEGTVRVRFCDK